MIRLTGPIRFCMNFSRKMRDDNVSSFAAESTLFILISFFPFLMFLLSIMQYLPITEATLFQIQSIFFPSVVSDYLTNLLTHIITDSSGTLMATTAIAFLWSGSKGFFSIERGLNSIYSRDNVRNYFLRRMLAVIYTLLFALFILFVLLIFVFGNQLYVRFSMISPSITKLALLIKSLRTGAGLLLLIILFTSMFRFIPNRRGQGCSFITELPGAMVASFGWIGFSYLYSFYIDNLRNFSRIYGNLTAIVLSLLWLYGCMYILFFGAEVNGLLGLYELRARRLRHTLERQAKKNARLSQANATEPAPSSAHNAE